MTEHLLPRHVAIVMDGNGRWAERRGLQRILGHREGIAEGVLHTPFPDQASQVVLALLQGVGDALGRLVLAPHSDDAQARAEQLVAAYEHALERVLGLPAGSLSLVDAPTLAEWFAAQLAYEARK